MQKTAAILLVVGIVIGAVVGYGGGFFSFQPTVNKLQSNVANLNSTLSKLQSNVANLNSTLSKSQTDLTTAQQELSSTKQNLSQAKSTISDLNNQMSVKDLDLRSAKAEIQTYNNQVGNLTADNQQLTITNSGLKWNLSLANNEIASLKANLSSLNQQLKDTQQYLQGKPAKNITIVAQANDTVYFGTQAVKTSTSFLAIIVWTPRTNWTGFGFYAVKLTQSPPADTGYKLGDIVILEVYTFNNVTVSGGKVDARGIVALSAGRGGSPTMLKEVIVIGIDEGVGLTSEHVTLQIETNPKYIYTLEGAVIINN